jgi:hypothetical protein
MKRFELTPGRLPIVRSSHTASKILNVHEDRFHTSTPIYVHFHVGSGPYTSSQRARGIELEIYQNEGCPVRKVHLKIDAWASMAKAVTRFRMAFLAWSIGWVAFITAYQLDGGELLQVLG